MAAQINMLVEQRVFERLGDLAREAGTTRSNYAKLLFDAAYSARWKKSGDIELEAKIGCALVLHAARQDTAEIALTLGLQESTIVRIIDAYRNEMAAP